MTNGVTFTDTSYYQVPIDNAYPHGVVSFRVLDGSWEDPIFRTNLRRAADLVTKNRLIAVVTYLVYRPGDQRAAAAAFRTAVTDTLGAIPRWLVAMIDAESWGGAIRGNQSDGLNRLYVLLAAILGGDPRRVLGYANRGDFAQLWPQRPARMRTVVASYGGSLPEFGNLIAWQYTNGEYQVDGLPSATRPFGACDHNVAPDLTPAQFAEQVGVLHLPTDPLEEVMAMYASKEAFEAMLDRKLGIDPQNTDKSGRTSVNGLFQFWMTRTIATLRTGTKNRAFLGPPSIIDNQGLQGAISRTVKTANAPVIDQHALNAAVNAAVAAAVAPLAAQVADLHKTLNEALKPVDR
ncbi:hypothetical protein M6D93_17675 [Jatrophihabitans telluris]|uniref:Uncharacterized protein n=1 Tax=Jatrophihabitans telluris TaxID=2038343 RepID=A0ABY4QXZ8_9ACTN|nr:hypothetical protein [Jatrophihabitans telluris]UQX88102.1 hypothetical protein M6D93_17675 [Jatrophihabitans telluris]